MQNKTQDEKTVHYEQKPDEVKPDYTPKRTYEPQSTDRRGFLKRTGTAVVVGLGGILFGKKALADGIDVIVGEEEGLRKVTNGYDGNNGQEYNEKVMCKPEDGVCRPESCSPCEPYCNPVCSPSDCHPDCHPECGPHSNDITDFKKVTDNYDGMTNCEPPCYPNCSPPTPPPGPCVPNCTPCEPVCDPNCRPHCGPTPGSCKV